MSLCFVTSCDGVVLLLVCACSVLFTGFNFPLLLLLSIALVSGIWKKNLDTSCPSNIIPAACVQRSHAVLREKLWTLAEYILV